MNGGERKRTHKLENTKKPRTVSRRQKKAKGRITNDARKEEEELRSLTEETENTKKEQGTGRQQEKRDTSIERYKKEGGMETCRGLTAYQTQRENQTK